MEIHVYDTYVKAADGHTMHFDVITGEKDHPKAIEYGKEWLKEIKKVENFHSDGYHLNKIGTEREKQHAQENGKLVAQTKKTCSHGPDNRHDLPGSDEDEGQLGQEGLGSGMLFKPACINVDSDRRQDKNHADNEDCHLIGLKRHEDKTNQEETGKSGTDTQECPHVDRELVLLEPCIDHFPGTIHIDGVTRRQLVNQRIRRQRLIFHRHPSSPSCCGDAVATLLCRRTRAR